jgi:RNA polymerase sigma-32 factor
MVEEPLTLEQLASRHAVSRERIRQIEVKAMEKMRGFLMAA